MSFYLKNAILASLVAGRPYSISISTNVNYDVLTPNGISTHPFIQCDNKNTSLKILYDILFIQVNKTDDREHITMLGAPYEVPTK